MRLIVIEPSQQSKGLGALLLAAFEKACSTAPWGCFVLTNDNNKAAQKFYLRHAYQVVGQLPGFAGPGRIDQVLWKVCAFMQNAKVACAVRLQWHCLALVAKCLFLRHALACRPTPNDIGALCSINSVLLYGFDKGMALHGSCTSMMYTLCPPCDANLVACVFRIAQQADSASTAPARILQV